MVWPRACAPYRARTKGKDENGVRYVKGNAIAGHSFDGPGELEAHPAWWMREIADARIHGTTGEAPLARFERDEAARLGPCAGTPFGQLRDLIRTVSADCAATVDTNACSVPWRLIGERVRVVASGGKVRVHHGGDVVAEHDEHGGRRARIDASSTVYRCCVAARHSVSTLGAAITPGSSSRQRRLWRQ